MKPILSLIFFVLCAYASSVYPMGARNPINLPPTIEVNKPSTQIADKVQVKFKIVADTKNASRIAKLREPVEKILNSEKFKTRVLNAWYSGKAQFVDTTLTNSQVYELIINANELNTGDDHIAYMQIGISKARCSTLGWTSKIDPMFYFNSCGFDARTDAGIAGTICHEWVHKLGFVHSKYNNPSRPYSAPYAIGTICAELYKDFI